MKAAHVRKHESIVVVGSGADNRNERRCGAIYHRRFAEGGHGNRRHDDQADQIVEVNLSGVLYAIHAVLPAMRDRKPGSIINIASWVGRIVSQMTGPAYTAAKHAILALTHSFNMDECRNGLRACCLSPGEVATPIMRTRPVPPSEEIMSKMLQPEDLGRTIAFVANLPPHVCVNEILISPAANRIFLAI